MREIVGNSAKQCFYTDASNKEWVVVFMINVLGDYVGNFLYDIDNNKFIHFLQDYPKQLRQQHNIKHTPTDYQCFIIDNEKHIL